MTGIEISSPQEVIFRGGVVYGASPQLIVREDGKDITVTVSVTLPGDSPDDVPGTPSVKTILTLAAGPTLTHKGNWGVWLMITVFSAVVAFTIFCADKLFYRRMSWRVRDPDMVEPSEGEIVTRYIGWMISIIAILVGFIWGLQVQV